MLPATSSTSKPAPRSSSAAAVSFSGRRAASGEGVALLAEHAGDGEADPARGSGDDRGAVWHGRNLPCDRVTRAPLTIMAVLAALLLGAVVADGGADGSAERAAAPEPRDGAGGRDRQARRGAARPALRRRCPQPVAVDARAGAARGARGPRPLLPRGAPARGRAGAQAARADRPVRRPARGVGVGVLRGRGGLLRPAHQADAHGARRRDGHARAGGDGARPRAHARARGPALRARARGPGRQRRRGAGAARRSSRAPPPS